MAAQMLGAGTTTATMPRVNLLPPEIAEKARLRKAQVAMVGTGLAAVAVLGVLYTQQSAKVSDARQAKADAVTANVGLTRDLGQLENVRQTYAQVDAAKATLASAMHSEVLFSGYLHDLTLTIPDNVWLTNFAATVTDPTSGPNAAAAGANAGVLDTGYGTVAISGTALSYDDIAAWLESLAKEKGYANPYFTQSIESMIGDRKVLNFTSSVNLTSDAMSNRYAKGLPR